MILKDKIAVVFAASGAIGGSVAKAFAHQGAHVYVSARNEEAARQLQDEIRQAGGRAEASPVDATDETAIDAYLSQIVGERGRLDVVFNGIGVRASQSSFGVPTTDLPFSAFMKPIETNLGSQFLTSRLAARYMIQTQVPGTILTLTASLSRLKVPFMAGITAACTGIEGLSRVMAAEFGMHGIKVICLNPTALYETRTIQETNAANARMMGLSPEVFAQQLQQQYLLRRSPTLADVGRMAAFLASDEGAMLNSHVVDVDYGTMTVI